MGLAYCFAALLVLSATVAPNVSPEFPKIDPDRADVCELKTTLGQARFDALKAEAESQSKTHAAGLASWMRLAEAEPSRDACESDRRAIDRATAAMADLKRDVWAGGRIPDAYEAPRSFAVKALATKDARLEELYRRTAEDQFGRANLMELSTGGDWAASLDPQVRAYLTDRLVAEVVQHDQSDNAWLRLQLASGGWFVISRYGKGGDNAAWLLVQHADDDLPLQQQVLGILGTLLRTEETSPQSYAYLWDRVAVAQHQPQRYGTQGDCQPAGGWKPFDVEDATNLDARRAAIKLSPMSKYKAMIAPLCHKA